MRDFPGGSAWEIPWTVESGGLQSMGLKQSDTTERLTGYNGQLVKLDPRISPQIKHSEQKKNKDIEAVFEAPSSPLQVFPTHEFHLSFCS